MKYFETIRSALDACFEGVCRHMGIGPELAMQYVRKHIETVNEQWFCGERPTIAYRNPLCRFAYLYCHTAVNANLCEVAIRRSPDIVELIRSRLDNAQELRVCAFGGGPGTELLALAKHLIRTRPNGPLARLSFTLLDGVTEWSESWNAIESQITQEMKNTGCPFVQWPFTICKTFVPYDMTKIASYANLPHLFQQDLYVLNYVVSEVIGDHDNFHAVMKVAAESSGAGSTFLIVDRDQDSIRAAAQHLLENAGLAVSPPVTTSTNMDSDEQASVLDSYIQQVVRRPRVQWGGGGRRGAFWMIGTR